MNKIYCASCGRATEYSISKPKFCGSCAEPFDAAFKKPVKKEVKASYEEDNDWEHDEPVFKQVKKLPKNLAQISIAKKVTMRDLAESDIHFERGSNELRGGGGIESDFDPKAQLKSLIDQRKARQ